MRVGTKSVLFGYHQFILHPLFVWAGWLKVYGWTWDPRIIISFFLHDLGYIGKPNMDGHEGEQHPYFGAYIMHKLFDKPGSPKWFQFSLYHSRKMAWEYSSPPSRLCWADKMAWMLYPKWLLFALYRLSGEGEEYQTSVMIDNKGTKLKRQKSWEEWYTQVYKFGVKMLADAGYEWKDQQ